MKAVARKAPLYEQAYAALREQLRAGAMRSGESVSELRLAEMIGMGRTPVREAVRRLLAEHVLETAPGGGLRIPLPTVDDFAEVYFTRAALEAEATRIATTVATPDFLRGLEDHHVRMGSAVASGELKAVIVANGAFHQHIVAFAGNKRISALLHSFEHIIVRYRSFSLAMPIHLRRSLQDHRQLIDLMRSGDANGAAEFARSHIMRAGGRVVRVLRNLEGIQVAPGATAALLLSKADEDSFALVSNQDTSDENG